MKQSISRVQLLDPVEITISTEDLAAGIKTRGSKEKILELADSLLSKVQHTWRPRAVFRWLEVEQIANGRVALDYPGNDEMKTDVWSSASRLCGRLHAGGRAGPDCESLRQVRNWSKWPPLPPGKSGSWTPTSTI